MAAPESNCAMHCWLSCRTSRGFSYTLDFRTVDRDPLLDPVEDFFANHRSGHCALYASSLVIMLRSLDIPAQICCWLSWWQLQQPDRLLCSCMVATLMPGLKPICRPEECTEEMFDQGMARAGGAWLTLGSNTASQLRQQQRSVWTWPEPSGRTM